MKVALNFAEHVAVNGIREVGTVGFALLASANLACAGPSRTWILDGEAPDFAALLADVNRAQKKFLSSSMSSALDGVCDAMQKDLPCP